MNNDKIRLGETDLDSVIEHIERTAGFMVDVLLDEEDENKVADGLVSLMETADMFHKVVMEYGNKMVNNLRQRKQ